MKQISFLPVAGSENPYQRLMIQGVESSGEFVVESGLRGRWLALLRTFIVQQPAIIHIDWIQSYYYANKQWQTYLRSLSFLFEIMVLKVTRVKLIWTLHNLYPHGAKSSWIQRKVRSLFAKSCFLVRVFSEETKIKACKEFNIPEKKVFVVPEGSYTNVYPNTLSKTVARKSLGIAEEKRVLLYVGGISEYKGVVELIDDYMAIDGKLLSNTVLVIAGKISSAYLRSEIRNKALKNNGICVYDRFISEADLDVFLNACDLVVLPFKRITNSGSVVLAMGYGKPVLTLGAGAVKDRLFHQNELLFQDNEGLKALLLEVINWSSEKLADIGRLNLLEVDKYKWEDFGALLMKHCR